jgi:hypothetical protein
MLFFCGVEGQSLPPHLVMQVLSLPACCVNASSFSFWVGFWLVVFDVVVLLILFLVFIAF